MIALSWCFSRRMANRSTTSIQWAHVRKKCIESNSGGYRVGILFLKEDTSAVFPFDYRSRPRRFVFRSSRDPVETRATKAVVRTRSLGWRGIKREIIRHKIRDNTIITLVTKISRLYNIFIISRVRYRRPA